MPDLVKIVAEWCRVHLLVMLFCILIFTQALTAFAVLTQKPPRLSTCGSQYDPCIVTIADSEYLARRIAEEINAKLRR